MEKLGETARASISGLNHSPHGFAALPVYPCVRLGHQIAGRLSMTAMRGSPPAQSPSVLGDSNPRFHLGQAEAPRATLTGWSLSGKRTG